MALMESLVPAGFSRNSQAGSCCWLGWIFLTIEQRILMRPFESPARSSSTDAIDGRGQNIGEGAADIGCLQAETVEQGSGDRAFRAVSELVECSTRTKMRDAPSRIACTLRDGIDRRGRPLTTAPTGAEA